jgi:hypothetical protein
MTEQVDKQLTAKSEPKDAFISIRRMTGKHLSDLFNIPLQQERAIRLAQAGRALESMSDDKPCPEWIQLLGERYSKGRLQFRTIKEARDWVDEYAKEHRRRCLMVQRGDILPMILYVAQQDYIKSIGNQMEQYKASDARKAFEDLANSTLGACKMADLSEDYEIDVALLACFQKDEMHTYSDVLDVVSGREEWA